MPAVNIRTDAYDIRVDRKSRWGNPFIMGKHGDRDEVCDRHREWLWRQIKDGRISLADLAALKDKRLGCHCTPLRCHADTLSAAADWAFRLLNPD